MWKHCNIYPLGAGEYTLALFSPSGVDSDNDGVGDGDYCFTTTVIEITEPEANWNKLYC